ncbi:MAG: glycosyltransferase family 2 protein [Candidatus Helarchaeota archaeon]
MIDLSIIIVNYNTKLLLKDCLNSIKKILLDIKYEIFVVDNASSDGSVEMLEKEFNDVNLIKNEKNVGFSRANNQAINNCSGKYILFLNSDTRIEDKNFVEIIKYMESNPKVGAICPKLVYENGTTQHAVSSFPNALMYFLRFYGIGKLFRSQKIRMIIAKYSGCFISKRFKAMLIPHKENNNIVKADKLSGACLILRKEVVSSVGTFDENFFLYVEDVDLCKRIKNAGWENIYFPKVEVIHLAEKSSGKMFRKINPEAYKSIYYYLKKHHTKNYFIFIKALIISALILKLIILTILRIFNLFTKKSKYYELYFGYKKIIKLSLFKWKYKYF